MDRVAIQRPKTQFASSRVGIKDFIKFLYCSGMNPSNVVCCVSEERGVVMYVYIGDASEEADYFGTVTYCKFFVILKW